MYKLTDFKKKFGDRLVPELIKAIRGSQSQSRLNERFDFAYNKVAKWEQNTTVRWSEFCRLCEFMKVELEPALREIYNISSSPCEGSLLVKKLKGQDSLKTLADRLDVSQSTIKRWISGTAEPTTQQIFMLLENRTMLLPQFLSRIVDLNRLPTSGPMLLECLSRAELFCSDPEASAVLSALSLKRYLDAPAHSSEVLASLLDLPVSRVNELVFQLSNYGFIRKRSSHYEIASYANLSHDRRQLLQALHYWMSFSQKKMLDRGSINPKEPLAYLVLPTTPELRKEMKATLRRLFELLTTRVDPLADTSFDQVSVLCVSLTEARGFSKMGVSTGPSFRPR